MNILNMCIWKPIRRKTKRVNFHAINYGTKKFNVLYLPKATFVNNANRNVYHLLASVENYCDNVFIVCIHFNAIPIQSRMLNYNTDICPSKNMLLRIKMCIRYGNLQVLMRNTYRYWHWHFEHRFLNNSFSSGNTESQWCCIYITIKPLERCDQDLPGIHPGFPMDFR